MLVLFIGLLLAILLAGFFYVMWSPVMNELINTGIDTGANTDTLNILSLSWDKWPYAVVIFAIIGVLLYIYRKEPYSDYYQGFWR